jgi:hypothetical protein
VTGGEIHAESGVAPKPQMKPHLVNHIKNMLRNFKAASLLPEFEDSLPPLPRTPVLKKRNRIEHFRKLLEREKRGQPHGRPLSQFANPGK